MQKERTLTKFECDNCKKESEEFEQPQKFIYDEGWNYLYHFELKVQKDKTFCIKNKHFCSKECLIKFVLEKINGIF